MQRYTARARRSEILARHFLLTSSSMELMRNALVVGAFFCYIILFYVRQSYSISPAVAPLFCVCLANINNPAIRTKKKNIYISAWHIVLIQLSDHVTDSLHSFSFCGGGGNTTGNMLHFSGGLCCGHHIEIIKKKKKKY